ncbi:hypothetical protein [Hyphomonas sp.]|jgi:hypothetical protein|uniref:hypothetical protein n=1 Tax=Hyphomonas sp. TaxID=87 RepID=UPI00356272CB
MKPFLFAAASLILLAQQALARDLIRVGTPAEHAGLFPQSAVWSAPDLLGGPRRAASTASSPTRIITVAHRRDQPSSSIRVFRGGSVTQTGKVGTEHADPALTGKTVIRLKKPPRNPYKTVIVYAPQSVRAIRARRNPD